MTTIRHATPILAVRDLRISIEYYQRRLGFERSWGWDAEETFGGVGDVDDLHRQLVERGADVREPPADRPWGMREILVADPDQHRLRFGSPVHGHPHR